MGGRTAVSQAVLLDTSVFIALETNRGVRSDATTWDMRISPITLAELKAGVLSATNNEHRLMRLRTVEIAAEIPLLVIDEWVADEWAALRSWLSDMGRRLDVNDLWIAATAIRYGMPVLTQDNDFFVVAGVRGLEVIQA
jgi:predicted nucleic acid-binding protein